MEEDLYPSPSLSLVLEQEAMAVMVARQQNGGSEVGCDSPFSPEEELEEDEEEMVEVVVEDEMSHEEKAALENPDDETKGTSSGGSSGGGGRGRGAITAKTVEAHSSSSSSKGGGGGLPSGAGGGGPTSPLELTKADYMRRAISGANSMMIKALGLVEDARRSRRWQEECLREGSLLIETALFPRRACMAMDLPSYQVRAMM